MKAQHERLGEILLPDFLIVGAAKSATTSLHHYLSQHPDIRMPSIKESWFFSFVGNPPHYESPGVLSDLVTTLEDYLKLFEGARPEQRLGDASPSYLYTYRDSILNIHSIYPPEELMRLKIIITLREPVSRAFSQYWTFKRGVEEPLTFEEAVDETVISRRLSENWNIFYDYTGFGRYYDQVKAYLDAFGAERVLVLLYDDIVKDTVAVCRTVHDFIGVDSSFVPDVETRHNDLTGAPTQKWLARILTSRNPVKRAAAALLPKQFRENILHALGRRFLKRTALAESTRSKLARDYADEIVRLEALIGRDLSSWRGGR